MGLKKLLVLLGECLIFFSLVGLYFVDLRKYEREKIILRLEENFEDMILKREILEKEREPEKNDMDDKNLFDNDLVVGIIKIDKLGIILPIFADTEKKALANGIGILEDTDFFTREKNKVTVLAGHRGGKNGEKSFLNIDKLDLGDEIKIITREEIFEYKVIKQEVIEKTDWSRFKLELGKTKLFLLTCHPYPKDEKRLIIEAELKR